MKAPPYCRLGWLGPVTATTGAGRRPPDLRAPALAGSLLVC